MDGVIRNSVITSLHCGFAQREEMPVDACQFFYDWLNALLAAKVTAESLLEMARTTYDQAMEGKQFGAANGSIREMGVLSGVRVERAEVGTPGEFDHLSDEELMADIEQRFARLRAETEQTEH